MRKTLQALVLAAALLAAGTVSAAAPDSVEAYAWSPNVNALVNGVADFLDAIGVPSATVRMMPMLLGTELLYSPALSGINLNKSFVVAVTNLDDIPDNLLIGFSTPGDAYRKSVGGALEKLEEADGVCHFARSIKTFDQEAYNNASIEEQEDYENFFVEEKTDVYLAAGDGFTWLSADREAILNVVGINPDNFDPGDGAAVSAVFRLDPLLAELKKSLTKVPAEGGVTPLDLIDKWAVIWDNISVFSFGLNPGGKGVEVVKCLEAPAGSKLAALLQGQSAGPHTLFNLLDPDSYLAWNTRMGRTDLMAEGAQGLMEAWMETMTLLGKIPGSEFGPKNLETFKKLMAQSTDLMKESFANLGDEMAFSVRFTPDSFMRLISISRIKDEAAFLAMMKKGLEMQADNAAEFQGKDEEMPFSFKTDFDGLKAPRSYSGVDIYSARMSFDWKDEEPDVPEEMTGMSAFIKDGLTFEYAVANGLGIGCYGGGKTSGIEQVIDRLQGRAKGFAPSAYPGIVDSWGAGEINYANIFQIFPSNMKTESGYGEAFARLTELDFRIPAVAQVKGNRLIGRGMISASSIKEAVEIFKQMENKKAGQAAPEEPQPAATD